MIFMVVCFGLGGAAAFAGKPRRRASFANPVPLAPRTCYALNIREKADDLHLRGGVQLACPQLRVMQNGWSEAALEMPAPGSLGCAVELAANPKEAE